MKILTLIFLFAFLFSLSSLSHAKQEDLCDKFKAKADYYNDLMRTKKVTQYYKYKHRFWMDKYYRCTSDRDNGRNQNEQEYLSKVPNNFNKPLSYQPLTKKNVKFAKDIEMTGYHSFKGAKRKAWEHFYKESPECLKNSNDMGTFVKCSSERKKFLELFQTRWNERTQSLDSPISH